MAVPLGVADESPQLTDPGVDRAAVNDGSRSVPAHLSGAGALRRKRVRNDLLADLGRVSLGPLEGDRSAR
jgi:hypothetical protein